MKIGLVLQPFTDENLRLAAQLGATDVVTNMPAGDYAELALLKSRIENAGLRLEVLEGLVPMNEAVMGTAGRTAVGSLMSSRLSNRLIRLSSIPVTLVR